MLLFELTLMRKFTMQRQIDIVKICEWLWIDGFGNCCTVHLKTTIEVGLTKNVKQIQN